MKKILCLMMAMLMVVCSAAAMADATVVDGGAARSVSINKAGDNEVPAGISPTTGLNLMEMDIPDGFAGLAATGRYMPMMVQIDNTTGGINWRKYGLQDEVRKEMAPWHAHYADVVYETPLSSRGETRISLIFSDLIPDYVAPIRSARVQHVWIRQEWDSAFVHWGGQKFSKTSFEDALHELGVGTEQNSIIDFDGTMGLKKWSPYMQHATDTFLTPIHSAYAMLASLVTQVVPADYVPAVNHTFKFTDELPTGGDAAEVIHVTWGNSKDYNSMLEYDASENLYYRYMMGVDNNPLLYEDHLPVLTKKDDLDVNNEAVTFSNVIVQFIDMKYYAAEAPLPTMTGTGNAEYFMGGQHFSGVWNRDTLYDRTVYYDMDGNEIELQRGHTLIIQMDYGISGRQLSYE